MTSDDEKGHDLVVEKAQPHLVDGVVRNGELLGQPVKHNGGVLCGDPDPDLRTGCKREGLVEGGNDSIPFFPSFFDNLGPRYWAPAASDVRLEMVPPAQRQFLKCKSSKTDSEGFRKPDGDGFKRPASKIGNVTLSTPGDDAVVYTPGSSRRGVENLQNLESNFESDELTSTYKPLVATSSGTCGRDVQTEVSSTSVLRGKCTRRIIELDASGEDSRVQLQNCTPVSSSGSTGIHHPAASHQSRKPEPSRDLQDKQKSEVRDRSSSLRSKRFRTLESLDLPDFPRIAPAILPSWRDNCEKIDTRSIHAVRYIRATQRRHRVRMRLSPDMSISRCEEALDKTFSTLRHWHFILGLDNPACPTVASHIFYRAFRMFKRSTWPTHMPETQLDRVRVLLALAFWISAKIVDTVHKIPNASRMASTASITAHSLIRSELPLLDALQWKLVRY